MAGLPPQSFWSAFSHMMLDIGYVSRGPEQGAFWMAIWIAFFNQAHFSPASLTLSLASILRGSNVISRESPPTGVHALATGQPANCELCLVSAPRLSCVAHGADAADAGSGAAGRRQHMLQNWDG